MTSPARSHPASSCPKPVGSVCISPYCRVHTGMFCTHARSHKVGNVRTPNVRHTGIHKLRAVINRNWHEHKVDFLESQGPPTCTVHYGALNDHLLLTPAVHFFKRQRQFPHYGRGVARLITPPHPPDQGHMRRGRLGGRLGILGSLAVSCLSVRPRASAVRRV